LKKNRVNCWVLALACGLVGVWAQIAHAAEPRLLLLEPPGSTSGLLTALRIQLVGLCEAERVVQPLAASAPEQIQAGTDLARSQHALASVWVDPPLSHTSDVVLLYVVGEREGRALVEAVRVHGARGPDLERTLALKVREVIAEMRRSQTAAALLPASAATATGSAPPSMTKDTAPPPRAAGSTTPPTAAWQAVLALGARLGSQPRLGLARWGLGLSVGPVLAQSGWRFEGLLSASWFPAVTSELGGDRVRFWELATAVSAHAQRRVGPVWMGAHVDPQLVWLDASGTTARGVSGAPYSRGIWGVALGADAEWPLGPQLALDADLQLQVLTSRERFTVNQRELVDIGQLRVRFGLSLVLRP
jgi:hypothetical protein